MLKTTCNFCGTVFDMTPPDDNNSTYVTKPFCPECQHGTVTSLCSYAGCGRLFRYKVDVTKNVMRQMKTLCKVHEERTQRLIDRDSRHKDLIEHASLLERLCKETLMNRVAIDLRRAIEEYCKWDKGEKN